MGWIIFAICMFLGFLVNIAMNLEKMYKPDEPGYKGARLFKNIMIGICISVGAIFVLWILGAIWYFFCSGFLVFEDQPFWDKVVCGLISLIPLGCVLGLIAIVFFDWDPWQR